VAKPRGGATGLRCFINLAIGGCGRSDCQGRQITFILMEERNDDMGLNIKNEKPIGS
jgi:hypothetical protein